MKKLFILIIAVILLFAGCTRQSEPLLPTEPVTDKASARYVKSVWLTYYELERMTEGKSEQQFRISISDALDKISALGLNTITVQARPCADALYKSDIFPVSRYFNGVQGGELTYDPLAIICNYAADKKISVEAWINPYRVSQDDEIDSLAESNIARRWLGSNKALIVDGRIYFNPADDEVKRLIISGVEEIVSNYPVSAIHFDDYFYPSTDKKIDEIYYKNYISDGGGLSLDDWRRENVSSLIRDVYSAIKKINSNVLFGISPCADIDKNRTALYADVERWCSNEGYIDYICPQVYFGFKNARLPFMSTVKKWVRLTDDGTVKLYIGLAPYKLGKPDKYASSDDKNAINEFVDNDDIISRQITYISKIDEISGYYLFSYSSVESKEIL